MGTDGRPFRFYDNRQKYLSFVTTCNEKWKVAERTIRELDFIQPTPPALRIYDAGMGDGTLLSHVMRATHKRFPTVPLYVVGKEISLEDIRMSLEKLPDRFVEHPATVVIFTNLYYAESPWLTVGNAKAADQVNWIDMPLRGTTAADMGEQLRALDPRLVDGWQVRASEKTGNPLYVKPSVLVLYREDQAFALDDIRPRPGDNRADYDLVIVSQPWRARIDAEFQLFCQLGAVNDFFKSFRAFPGGLRIAKSARVNFDTVSIYLVGQFYLVRVGVNKDAHRHPRLLKRLNSTCHGVFMQGEVQTTLRGQQHLRSKRTGRP